MSQLMLLRLADNAIVGGPYDEGQRVGDPDNADGTIVAPAIAGWEGGGAIAYGTGEDGSEIATEGPARYRLVSLVEVNFARPGPYYTQGADTGALSGDGQTWTVTRAWTAWTQAEIDAWKAVRHASAAAVLDQVDDATRAALLLLLDDRNAIVSAIANGNSLAAIKAALPAANVTPAQFKAAVINRMTSDDSA